MNFNQVLFIGPDYRKLKGGIASVLETYSLLIRPFFFLGSIRTRSVPLSMIQFPFILMNLILLLVQNPNLKIIHVHGSHGGSILRKYLVFIIGKRIFRKAFIYHIHSSHFHIYFKDSSSLMKLIVRDIINNADSVVSLSNSWNTYFSKNFSPRKLRVVPNIVPFHEDNKKELNKTLVILFLGKIEERKGIFDLLNVIKENYTYFDSKVLFKIGGFGEIEKLENFIKKNRLEEIVKFKGFLTGENKQNVLKQSDILVLPSYNEGLPIAILEAMANKLCVISTKVGGIPELIQDNVNGLLFDAGNLHQLKDKLTYLIENRNRIIEFSENGFNVVKDSHFPDKVLDEVSKLYNGILSD